MSYRSSSLLAAALLVLPLAAPLSPVLAQEAIQLEVIGAVRMATPQEVQRMNAEATRQSGLPAPQPVSLQRQHASVAD